MNKRLITLGFIFLAVAVIAKSLFVIFKNIKIDDFHKAAVVFVMDSSASNQDMLPDEIKFTKSLCSILDPEDHIKILKVSQDSYLIYEGAPSDSKGITKAVEAFTKYDSKDYGTAYGEAIKKAHDGRMFIMKHMLSVLPGPRDHLSPYAPRIEKLKINPDKIGTVIGKGGETINKITAETGAEINISEDGLITISAVNTEAIDKALEWVKSLVEEPEVGKIYKGKVVSIKDFGAFVNILPGIDGMLHISQISDKHLDKVTDVLNVGDEVKVRLDAIDDKGRLSLSMKRVEQDK